MLEGKALVIAIMMLTAAPIAATDSGQIFIGDVRDNFEDMLANDEPTKVSEIIDDSDRSAEEDTDVPCFTFEEWKERCTTWCYNNKKNTTNLNTTRIQNEIPVFSQGRGNTE